MSKDVYWTMRNGQKINVDDMSIEHLRNTLKMIIRNNEQVSDTCPHNIENATDFSEMEIERHFRKSQYELEREENIWKEFQK